jgi:hypothetical protein
MTALARGSTIVSTLGFIARDFGDEAGARVLAALPSEHREAVGVAHDTQEIPFSTLIAFWRAADGVLAPLEPAWIEHSGAFAIESGGVRHYSGILRKASPLEFLTQRVSLFRLFYQPGNQEVVEHEPGRAVLRLVGFDAVDPLFCRRQTGGLQRALEIAGATSAAVRHVRCSLEGDAFCEWELTWS